MRKWGWLGLVALLLWVGTAGGDSMIRPASYRTVAGSNVFVMLAPGAEPIKTPAGVAYPHSGLYKDDGSTTALWTVDWWAYSVMLSADGHHLARLDAGQSKGEFQAVALAFYADGVEYQHYRVSDLVRHPERMQESVSHFQWLRSSVYEPVDETLRLTTEEGRSYQFDIRAGTMTPGQVVAADTPAGPRTPAVPERLPGTYVEVVVVAGLVLAGVWWWRRRRSQR